MLQVYLVRHGETQWNAERRIQGQSDSPLTAHGERQAWQVGERARTLGITHIITSDLGRTRRTAEIIAEACGCSVIADARLRELDMGVLEKRHIDSLSEEEEGWRRQLVNGTPDGRIPQGESMQELSERMHAALASCLELPAGSRPLPWFTCCSRRASRSASLAAVCPRWRRRRIRRQMSPSSTSACRISAASSSVGVC
ncbi:2,3-diphosphoglycerate-dependent phosphoglycerate mutase GpmB [Klebsiella sp. K4-170]|uniref:2,3-diphosphoglycerate-dependent phosphoglycerate mutase GpmB n=1 Tax=Klebsiella sp. K4-170 TaxID=2920184 RepID=UPI0024DEBE90|nr:2,3-diphosphoglycerate-dependent phosphoglycerate mutase GpmB [Klebsiella sp. K4-170]MDK1904553.1 2,3-diphosphoglycerate-dependent phosphoglycerate mutase GpmB [Klebsiella sp. K4-170]